MYCLPHAGGGASAYHSWGAEIADFIEVCLIQLPGREWRLDEPAVADSEELADVLTAQITAHADRPYVLFGHSMGGRLAYEIALRTERAGVRSPLCVVASAFYAPTLPNRSPLLSDLPEDQLVANLVSYGGLPSDFATNQDFLRFLLPTVRADLAVVESFGLAEPGGLSCPVSVFAGDDDEYVAREDVLAWQDATTGRCTVRFLPGGHFFLRENSASVLAAVAEDLALHLELSR
jgi:medium-chain acyl-[acyl-carrier-protein] hydrolase